MIRYIIVISVTLLLYGCDYQHQLNINLHTAHYLNPDQKHQSKPIVVSLFQLTQPFPFKKLNYQDIHDNPSDKLSGALIDYQEIELTPESKKSLISTVPVNCHYIGIIAGFHKLVKNQWKVVIPLPKTYQKMHLNIFIGTNTISAKIEESLL